MNRFLGGYTAEAVDMREFWDQQAEWSNGVFGPDRTRGPIGPIKHLGKEAIEALKEAELTPEPQMGSDDLKTEIVDCLLLTFDAARRSGMSFQQLTESAFAKLEINKSRHWPKPTSDEPVEHLRDGEV